MPLLNAQIKITAVDITHDELIERLNAALAGLTVAQVSYDFRPATPADIPFGMLPLSAKTRELLQLIRVKDTLSVCAMTNAELRLYGVTNAQIEKINAITGRRPRGRKPKTQETKEQA